MCRAAGPAWGPFKFSKPPLSGVSESRQSHWHHSDGSEPGPGPLTGSRQWPRLGGPGDRPAGHAHHKSRPAPDKAGFKLQPSALRHWQPDRAQAIEPTGPAVGSVA